MFEYAVTERVRAWDRERRRLGGVMQSSETASQSSHSSENSSHSSNNSSHSSDNSTSENPENSSSPDARTAALCDSERVRRRRALGRRLSGGRRSSRAEFRMTSAHTSVLSSIAFSGDRAAMNSL